MRGRPIEAMLEAANRLTLEQCRALWDERRAVALKEGPLSAAECDLLRRVQEATKNHPAASTLTEKLALRGKGPQWLDTFIRDELWTWAWWADRFGQTDVEYMTQGQYPHSQAEIDAVTAARPYPKGWMPETRRH